MNAGSSLIMHIVLTPLLVLSQPPWSELGMLLVRLTLTGLFCLALLPLMMRWWHGRHAPERGHYAVRDWVIPLCLAGLGLLLLCSSHRGTVDRLFTQVDRVLMNGSLHGPAPAKADASWYRVMTGTDEGPGQRGRQGDEHR
ncbi:hypothetical protein JHW33_07495 [Rahnella aceris]|uniref:hypothetical protein n=1 Tax=Rahnella sp. (strain Y9602) TaxID=2703885 RepID=UPI0019067192|nr:hypothetical protein [Rahnella aceris]QQN36456.1 hypothetical protein JHW33_07495 [Rahnella aceris]